jgi:hypothetical protein
LVTRDLAQAGKILKIEVLDHVVMGKPGHVSLREQGYLFTNNPGRASPPFSTKDGGPSLDPPRFFSKGELRLPLDSLAHAILVLPAMRGQAPQELHDFESFRISIDALH